MNAIHPAVAATLRAIIGLDVDDADALHQKLAATITDLGPGATYGQRIVALRFDFVWELRDAGKVYGEAKGDYEGTRSRRVVEITETALSEGRKVTLGLAEHMAEAELYELKLTYLVAEQRERAMRKFLDALDAALDNFRTMQANERAADLSHARGIGGHS